MDYSSAKILKCYGDQDYPATLRLIEEAEAAGFVTPETLIIKARVLQLDDGGDGYELADVQKMHEDAIAIDPSCDWALTDLAYFHLNVMDDAARALPLFEEALAIQKAGLTETVVGILSCLMETNPPEVAQKRLLDISQNLFDSPRIQEVLADVWTYRNKSGEESGLKG